MLLKGRMWEALITGMVDVKCASPVYWQGNGRTYKPKYAFIILPLACRCYLHYDFKGQCGAYAFLDMVLTP